MSLARVFRRLIAVRSHSVERVRPQPAAPEPDAGARWGRPASFEIPSRQVPSDEPASLSYEWLDTSQQFKGVESHRAYVTRAASVDGTILEPEAIRSVTFFLGTREVRHERREIEGGVTNVTPVIETIRDYVKLAFPFGDAEGARGEPHPAPTPPREEPDYG